jgi:hypothetical protein
VSAKAISALSDLHTLKRRNPRAVPASERKIFFAPGKRAKTISIRIKANGIYQSSETLSLELSKPSAGAILARPSNSRLTIANVAART